MSVGYRIAYGFGAILIILGLALGFTWPFIFDYVSREKLALSDSSETYKLWVKTPIPMFLEVYLFNWTNSEEFLRDKTVKPQFEEIGPFVFREAHERVDVEWNGNSSVSYNQTRTWHFVPEESIDLSTPVVNLNVVATTVTKMASKYSNLVKYLVHFLNFIYKEKLLVSRPANEWLFDGIRDKLLDYIRFYINVPYDKFGWFYARNLSSTFDGRFKINTGEDDIFSLGELEEWNYVNKTNFYDGECGVVKGSSGELFSPLKNDNSNLSIFVSDFCGPITLKYSGHKSVAGLSGYHYVGDEGVFDNGTTDPGMKCFCNGECVPSGVRNVTSCRQAPLFISFPHFYLADPSYAEAVEGMNPNKSDHEFYLSIDPSSGTPLEVRAQIQINVLLEPLEGFPMFSKVPKVYIPMMWFRQRAKITPQLASRVNILQILAKVGLWLAYGFGFLGFFMIILLFSLQRFSKRNKHFELLITPSESTGDLEQSDTENAR